MDRDDLIWLFDQAVTCLNANQTSRLETRTLRLLMGAYLERELWVLLPDMLKGDPDDCTGMDTLPNAAFW